jgi:hypothetical protein
VARSPAKDAVATLIARAPIDERSCVPRLYSHAAITRAIYGCHRPAPRHRIAIRRAVARLVASGEVIGETDPDWPSRDEDPRRSRSAIRRLVALESAPTHFTRRMTAEERRARERFIRDSTRELRERFLPIRAAAPGARAAAAAQAPELERVSGA